MVQFNVVQRDVGDFDWTTGRSHSCIAVDGSTHASLAEEHLCAALRASGLDSYPETRYEEVATGKLLLNLANALSKFATAHTGQVDMLTSQKTPWLGVI